MANEKLNELKQEADSLGITYGANIKEETLQNKIDTYRQKDAEAPEVIPQNVVEDSVDHADYIVKKDDALQKIKINLKRLQRENAKTKVVKLTMVDKREVGNATSAYFSDGNLSMRVPLDVYVEMPIGLIKLAERQKAILSVRSGESSVTKEVPKYVVEYKDR